MLTKARSGESRPGKRFGTGEGQVHMVLERQMSVVRTDNSIASTSLDPAVRRWVPFRTNITPDQSDTSPGDSAT